MMRRDQICPGPGECGDVLMVNPRATAESERCEQCPLTLLDEYLATPGGQLALAAIDLDFALQAGVAVRLSDISYPEFLLLRLLSEERNRFHEDQMKKASRNGR